MDKPYELKERLQYDIQMGWFKIAALNHETAISPLNQDIWLQARFVSGGFFGWFQSFDACFDAYLTAKNDVPILAYRDIQSARSLDVRWNWHMDTQPVNAYVEDLNEHREHYFESAHYPIFELLSMIKLLRKKAPSMKPGDEVQTVLFFSNELYPIYVQKGIGRYAHFEGKRILTDYYLLTIDSKAFASSPNQLEVFVTPDTRAIPFMIQVKLKYATVQANLSRYEQF